MSSTAGFSVNFLKNMFAARPKRQIRELYIFLLLFSLAASLITVFEPVFFWQQGFAMWQIAMYYTIHYALYAILMPLGAKFAAHFGFERSLIVSTPAFVAYFLILAALPKEPGLFWVAIVVLTLFKIFFWPAYHASFSTYSDAKNEGTEQSWVRMIQYSAAIVGPAIGGLLAANFGFSVMFTVLASIIALAGFSLLRTNEHDGHHDFSYREPWKVLSRKKNQNLLWSSLGWIENLIYLAVWPVFVFIALNSLSSLGLVASLGAAMATLWGFAVGEISDRLSAKKSLKYFSPFVAVSYAWRAFSVTPWQIIVGDVFSRMATVSFSIPFLSRLYRQGKASDPLTHVTAFEMALSLSKCAGGLALMIIFFYAPSMYVGFLLSFLLAAVSSLLYQKV